MEANTLDVVQTSCKPRHSNTLSQFLVLPNRFEDLAAPLTPESILEVVEAKEAVNDILRAAPGGCHGQKLWSN